MKRTPEKPGHARILEAWTPPDKAGEPLGCIATSFTFASDFFEEECLGRFADLESTPEDGSAYLIEREEKFAQLKYAAALVDQIHAKGPRSMRWHLLSARLRRGIQHSKVALLLWTGAARLIVSSANITNEGYRKNHEVFAVLDYSPDGKTPLAPLIDIMAFLEDAVSHVDPGSEYSNTAVKGWIDFVKLTQANTKTWGAEKPSKRIFSLLTAPSSSSIVERIHDIKPVGGFHTAKVVSPFFDSPDAPVNLPAQQIWNCLTARGVPKSVTYVMVGEEIPGSEDILLRGPESLRWTPGKNTIVTFGRIKLEETRLLHAKCIWLESNDWIIYILGSSNFTSAGLGIGTNRNLEANLAFVVDAEDKTAVKALNEAWLDHSPVNDPRLIPLPDTGEDTSTAESTRLPEEFGSITYAKEAEAWLEFTFNGVPPGGWQLFPEDDEDVFLTEAEWNSRGNPDHFKVPWMESRPPVWFRVTWKGAEGCAFWNVNVRDGASLPLPAELSNLTLDDLIEILTSRRPLHLAIGVILERELSDENDAIVDPHKKVDSSSFLLQRTRRVSGLLRALRERLEKPIPSTEALEWRLRGPIGASAVMKAIVKECNSEVEKAFLLTELMLELSRVNPKEILGGLSSAETKAGIHTMIMELRGMIEGNSVPRAFLPYFTAALEVIS